MADRPSPWRGLRGGRASCLWGACPPRPHPGGAGAARRSAHPPTPDFLLCGGLFRPPRPRRARRTRRGFEGSRASCLREAAPLTLPAGHGARGADSRAAARLVRGRLRPPRPRRARRTRRGFEGSRASCPREAAPLTLPAGHGARGADSRAAARLVRGRLRPSRSPSGTAHAARVRGQPRVLSAGGCAPHAPRRSGARAAGWGARPPFSARERATVMVRPLQN